MIEFTKKVVTATIMDPREGYARKSIETEIRFDPLTGESGRLAHFGMLKAQKDDFSAWDTPAARERCPFCPSHIESMTPRFPPEIIPQGHLHKGEARVIANISPYDQYSALTVMSHGHLLTLKQFTRPLLKNAFSVGLDFFQIVAAKETQLPYFLIIWNYMPPSGGGIVHPHQQLIITSSPGNLLRKTMAASKRYYASFGKNYWSDLCALEESRNERYVGKLGEGHWLSAYLPLGVLGDYLAVFPDIHTIFDVHERIIDDLVAGLLRLFSYFDSKNIYSFNMGLYFAPVGEAEKYFSLHARIIPRTVLNLIQKPSDINSLQLVLQEPFAVEEPEKLCSELKTYWRCVPAKS